MKENHRLPTTQDGARVQYTVRVEGRVVATYRDVLDAIGRMRGEGIGAECWLGEVRLATACARPDFAAYADNAGAPQTPFLNSSNQS